MTGKSPITTHVLDTGKGIPAKGVSVRLEQANDGGWKLLSEKTTDADGRISNLLSDRSAETGTYRLTFDTGSYFGAAGIKTFYPGITVTFQIEDPTAHYHVPLLLSPFGYSTYRGS